jgi:plastocyanin
MERLGTITIIGVVMILVATIEGLTLILNTITSAQGQPTSVSIVQGASNQNNGKFFEPQEINVKTGDSVKWTNNDITVHTVTAGTPGQGPNQQAY